MTTCTTLSQVGENGVASAKTNIDAAQKVANEIQSSHLDPEGVADIAGSEDRWMWCLQLVS